MGEKERIKIIVLNNLGEKTITLHRVSFFDQNMNFETIKYQEYLASIPNKGKYILAQQTKDEILVYQAFNHQIADFALNNQFFGGNHYSYKRMSWIKTNFLWMMYRAGWAEKENQERILGIWILKSDFEKILGAIAHSSYKSHIYETKEIWQKELQEKEVRLQWDPDHDIYGNKQTRKAIQLGLKGNILETFGKDMVKKIIDVTSFVREQKTKITQQNIEELLIPQETIYVLENKELTKKIDLII